MATSTTTNWLIIDTVLKHIEKEKAIVLFEEIVNIPGNSSFKTSVMTILKMLKN